MKRAAEMAWGLKYHEKAGSAARIKGPPTGRACGAEGAGVLEWPLFLFYVFHVETLLAPGLRR
jgi:hypothetical protein